VAKLYPQAPANFVFPSSDTEPSFGKLHHRSVYHRLLRPQLEIWDCVHDSLQNNGTALFVVKVLAAGVRRALNSDVLASVLSMQFGKSGEYWSFSKFLYIFHLLKKAHVVHVVRFIWHGLSGYSCIHIAATINSVIVIMHLHYYYYYYYYYYFIWQCALFIKNAEHSQWNKRLYHGTE
jgi:hypothetical protein